MLTRDHRLASSRAFTSAVRRGRRAAAQTMVLHLAAVPHEPANPGSPIQIGFVVSKTVGPSVTRNRVKRRLRHIARELLTSLPDSTVLVVRALPSSADASYAVLRSDFEECVRRLLRERRHGGCA